MPGQLLVCTCRARVCAAAVPRHTEAYSGRGQREGCASGKAEKQQLGNSGRGQGSGGRYGFHLETHCANLPTLLLSQYK